MRTLVKNSITINYRQEVEIAESIVYAFPTVPIVRCVCILTAVRDENRVQSIAIVVVRPGHCLDIEFVGDLLAAFRAVVVDARVNPIAQVFETEPELIDFVAELGPTEIIVCVGAKDNVVSRNQMVIAQADVQFPFISE